MFAHVFPDLPGDAGPHPAALGSADAAANPTNSLGAIRELLALPPVKGRAHALIVLDIDQLNRVNQSHGELTGDRVLQGLALILKRLARHDGHTVLRSGDDEFAVLMRSAEPGEAEALAEAARSWMQRLPDVLPGAGALPTECDQRLSVSVSAGVACFGANRSCVSDGPRLFDLARGALRSAKRAGGDRTSVA